MKRAPKPGLGTHGLARRWSSLLVLAAHFMMLAHMLVVRHITCPEHGELLDVYGKLPTRSEPTPAQVAAASSKTQFIGRPGDPLLSGGHQHCLLLLHRREQLALLPVPTALPLPWPAGDSMVIASADRMPARFSGLFIAPKTSPPS